MRTFLALGVMAAVSAGCGSSTRESSPDSRAGASGSGAASGNGGTQSGSGGATAGGGGTVARGGSAGLGGTAGSAGRAGATSGGTAGSGAGDSGGGGKGGDSGAAGDAGTAGGGGASKTGQWVWQSNTAASDSLNGVWAAAANDVWAVGNSGTLIHWDGDKWSAVDAGTHNHLQGVRGSSADDIWAVAGGVGGGEPNLVHFDGTAWSAADPGTTTNLYALWGTAANDVWAVGASGVEGVITHYDGDHWTPSYQTDLVALRAISGTGAGDAWAVGGTFTPRGLGYHAAVHWSSGGPWLTDPSASFPEVGAAVWTFSANDVWALGETGTLHFDGSGWTARDSSTLAGLRGLWGSDAGRLTAVGPAGRIEEFDGSTWNEATSGGAVLNAVTGPSDSDRWAVGEGGTILHFESDLIGEPDCAAIGGDCVTGGSCPGQPSDYACADAGSTCCVAATACNGGGHCCGPTDALVPAICHDGLVHCPAGASMCPPPPPSGK